jgi:predicted AlkP superfamily pyrophosphatase or phosphodiesterase
MHYTRRVRTTGSVFLLLAACAGCAGGGPATVPVAWPGSGAAPVRLLVTIVVDQLAAWVAAERWPELPADGGFARLRREGLTVRELHYLHAATDTAPGHSALYTGAAPRDSGIVGNDVIRDDGTAVSMLEDRRTRLVVAGHDVPVDKPGSSLAALRVATVADLLSAHDPDAAIFSFSLKDRGALFAAGRRPTLALWFDPGQEAFVSSTAFTTRVPDWAAAAGGATAVRAAAAAPWQLLDAAWVAAHASTADDQDGEGDYAGLGRTFPHVIKSAKTLRATPAGDDLLFALARAALAHVAPAPHATLMALSLSSNDYIGHIYGPDSWEAWDELLRLDRRLAEWLALLDGAVGPDGYAVMLTGDHGISALPELTGPARAQACARVVVPLQARDGAPSDCHAGRRVEQPEVVAALEATARRVLGGVNPTAATARLIAGVADPWVYFTPLGAALDAKARARLVEAAARDLRMWGIIEVVDTHVARPPCPPDAVETRAALVCRSMPPFPPPASSPDLYLVVEPWAFFDPRYVQDRGVHHGSPYLYDRAVPLLVRAPGRVPAGQVRATPVASTAFARTAAALLGLQPPPAAAAGEDLTTPAPR